MDEENYDILLKNHALSRVPCRNGDRCKWYQQGKCRYAHRQIQNDDTCIPVQEEKKETKRTMYKHEPIGDPTVY